MIFYRRQLLYAAIGQTNEVTDTLDLANLQHARIVVKELFKTTDIAVRYDEWQHANGKWEWTLKNRDGKIIYQLSTRTI